MSGPNNPEQYEWVWDCESCDSKGILGRHQHCTNCNAPRPPGDIFYDPANAPEIKDEKLLRLASAAPDWLCEHCGGSTSGASTKCAGCSAPKGSSPVRRTVDYALGQEPKSSPTAPKPRSYEKEAWEKPRRSTGDLTSNRPEAEQTPSFYDKSDVWSRGENKSRDKFNWLSLPVIASVCATLIFIALIYAYFKTHVETIKLTKCTWQRVITVEKWKTVRESDWSIPSGGREVSHYRALHHYNKVFDHTETYYVTERYQSGTETYRSGTRSKGNGFAEATYSTRPVYSTRQVSRTRPVYRDEAEYHTKYDYDIERWKFEREARLGADNQSPAWPNPNLASNERENGRKEEYHAIFLGPEPKRSIFDEVMPEARWKTFVVGNEYQAKINFYGQLKEILTPEA